MTLVTPGQLPTTLRHLTLGHPFSSALPVGWLPARLTHLVVESGFTATLRSCRNLEGEVLPASLRSLVLPYYKFHTVQASQLPARLRHLAIHVNDLSGSSLPSSLISLSLSTRQPIPPRALREGLVDFTLTWYPHALGPGVLPCSLHRLRLGRGAVQFALNRGVLPVSLRVLELSTTYRERHGTEEQPPWLPRDTELRFINDT
jgi:hypothetical protein